MIRYQQLIYRPGYERQAIETMLELYAKQGWMLVAATEHGNLYREASDHFIRLFLRKDED